MKATMNMNDLIDSVRNKPELWDKNHPNYRDQHLKSFLWKEVCRELNWGLGGESSKILNERKMFPIIFRRSSNYSRKKNFKPKTNKR